MDVEVSCNEDEKQLSGRDVRINRGLSNMEVKVLEVRGSET